MTVDTETTLTALRDAILGWPAGHSVALGNEYAAFITEQCETYAVQERGRLCKILSLITDAQQVCEDSTMTTMDHSTQWYLSESTLGLAKVLIRAMIEKS